MIQTILLIWVLAWTLIAFALMGIDKWKARHDSRRIPEKTLFLSAILGGSVGSLAGMYLFRHKTKHLSFTVGMPLILAVQVALVLLLAFRFQLVGG